MLGYFQNNKWFNYINKNSNDNFIASFLNDYLSESYRSCDNILNKICLHIRHIQIDQIISSQYFIDILTKLSINNRVDEIIISCEKNTWLSSYKELHNYMQLHDIHFESITELSECINTMLRCKIFIATKSTLSDWISYIRDFNNFEYSITVKYE